MSRGLCHALLIKFVKASGTIWLYIYVEIIIFTFFYILDPIYSDLFCINLNFLKNEYRLVCEIELELVLRQYLG